jgi:hypothetical protein
VHPMIKARKILEVVYARPNASLPIEVPHVVDALRKLTDFDDLIWRAYVPSMPESERQFRGMFLPELRQTVNGKKKVGVAYIPDGLNQKEMNLRLVKELTHALDPKGHFCCTPAQLEAMVAPLLADPPLLDLDFRTATDADVYGVYAALETLVPVEMREYLYDGRTDADLSDFFQVPPRVISTTRNPNYVKLVEDWKAELGITASMRVDGAY